MQCSGWLIHTKRERYSQPHRERERESEQRHESNTVKREVETTEEKKSMGGRWGEVKEGGVELESGAARCEKLSRLLQFSSTVFLLDFLTFCSIKQPWIFKGKCTNDTSGGIVSVPKGREL